MPLRWVLFDLNGTLVDPAVMAQPLGDSAADEELVQRALDDAIHAGDGAHARRRQRGVRGAARRRAAPAAGAGGPRPRGWPRTRWGCCGSMPAYIDAPAALERLRGVGLRLGVLTQSAPEAADAVLRFAGLRDRLELVVSAPRVGRVQARPAALPAGGRAHGRRAGEVGLVAAHWWDVAGAKARRAAHGLGRAARPRAARRRAGARRRRPRPHRGAREGLAQRLRASAS